MNKIFVQIASYRDPELLPTLKDMLEKATNPNNLHICIAWQHSKEDKWDNLDGYQDDPRFTILDIPHNQSLGACWARNQIQQHYKEEDYTLQLDSHHRFIQGWDTELIKMYNQLKEKGHQKPLLTSYIPSYNPKNDPKERVQVPWKMNFDKFTPEGIVFFLPGEIEDYKSLTEPIPSRFYSAHFAFTTGKFAQEVQHDPTFYFHGEEITIAVRAFTHGYDLFHPHKIIAWHEYTREGRTKHWDDDKEWGAKNTTTHSKVRQLLGVDGEVCSPCVKKHFGKYGLGEIRTLRDYEKYAGISFEKRAAQKYTLDYKLPPNPDGGDIEFDNSFTRLFEYNILIEKNNFDIDEDYSFWVVIFENGAGRSLYRQDLNSFQIVNLLKSNSLFIKIPSQFLTEEIPTKWIVWPYSPNGWLDKIEGKL